MILYNVLTLSFVRVTARVVSAAVELPRLPVVLLLGSTVLRGYHAASLPLTFRCRVNRNILI